MKLKPSVVAVLLAFSTAAAFAGDSDKSAQTKDEANPTQAVGNAPSSSVENAAADETGWQYLNGQTQAAASGGDGSAPRSSASNEQPTMSEDSSKSEPSAATEEGSGASEQAAGKEDSAGGDQAAMSEDSAGSDQAAASVESAGAADQSASSEEPSGDDQSAMSEDSDREDQSAAAGQEGGDDQVAQDSVGDDHVAMAEPGTRSGTFKPATLEDFKAATQDKLVVILPSGWQGSVQNLISSLQGQSDTEILVLSQDDPDDSDQ